MNQIIDLYDRIRKIPYKIIDIEYSLANSYNLIKENGASCTPKHIVLADIYRSQGIETRFCVHEFRWEDLGLDFNARISDLLNQCSFDFHTNIEIKINKNWIIVDATWDDKLIDMGFSGTKNWDGITSTINGVKSLNEFRFDSLEERNDFIKIKKSKIKTDPLIEAELIMELNNYFDKLRK
jgi:hypothetical protein